jgi:hypothetical protein
MILPPPDQNRLKVIDYKDKGKRLKAKGQREKVKGLRRRGTAIMNDEF